MSSDECDKNELMWSLKTPLKTESPEKERFKRTSQWFEFYLFIYLFILGGGRERNSTILRRGYTNGVDMMVSDKERFCRSVAW